MAFLFLQNECLDVMKLLGYFLGNFNILISLLIYRLLRMIIISLSMGLLLGSCQFHKSLPVFVTSGERVTYILSFLNGVICFEVYKDKFITRQIYKINMLMNNNINFFFWKMEYWDI